jgi:hypothetical protein
MSNHLDEVSPEDFTKMKNHALFLFFIHFSQVSKGKKIIIQRITTIGSLQLSGTPQRTFLHDPVCFSVAPQLMSPKFSLEIQQGK